MTLAEKLKSIRKQAGMSQEQLAEKLGVSRQAVTKWETDAGIPDIENVIAIFTFIINWAFALHPISAFFRQADLLCGVKSRYRLGTGRHKTCTYHFQRYRQQA